jgi:hypothetical protein
VVAVFAEIKFGLLTDTVAPRTAAPFGSVTLPSIDPVVDVWPATWPAHASTSTSNEA